MTNSYRNGILVSNETLGGDRIERSDLRRGEAALLRSSFLFEGAEEPATRALSDERCRLVTAEKGSVISDIYDYRQNLVLLLSGTIAVTKPTSRRFMMKTLTCGGIFGAADLYDEGSDHVTVLTARKDCRLLFFPQPLLEELMRENYRIADNYIRFLTGRIRFLNEKIESLVVEGTEASLAHYLATRAPGGDGGKIVRLESVSSLAEELHIGRASLYRALKVLEDDGLIRQNGRDIVVLDAKRLSSLTNDGQQSCGAFHVSKTGTGGKRPAACAQRQVLK